MTDTQYLDRPGGRIAYEDCGGSGPLVVAAPGMGDVRQVYRHLAPSLIAEGFRFVTMDLRGLGESSAKWADYSDQGVASDYLALVAELNAGPAVLIGNSLSCASAVLAATDGPDQVSAIALIGPFVRPAPSKWWEKMMFAAMLAPPWGRSVWVSYYRSKLYPGPKPRDIDDYASALSKNLAEKGRMSAFRGLAANKHAESGRQLTNVTQPVLVVMGTADPDFPDPVAEAEQIGELMNAEVLMVDGSGHYPQADGADAVSPAIIELVNSVNSD